MNDKALEYAFGLFQQDGYTGTLDEYKELIGKDQEAMDYSFGLFSNDGYSGNKDQFSALVMPGKTEPIAPGVAVEETAAPVIKPENTESELERGFLGFNEIARSLKEGITGGFSRADAAGETLTIFSKLGDAEKYEYNDFVNVVNKYNEEGNIAEFEKWSNSYDQYKEAGNNAVMSTLLATKDEGIAGFSGVLVQSLAGLISPESLGAASALGAAGAGVGSVIPGVGTGIVGVSSAMAGANAMSETMITFASNIQEELAKKNLEFTGANVQALMQDQESASSIRNKSLARGLTIGAIEGVFTALGGKAFSSTARAVKGVTGSKKIGDLVGSGATGATEMIGGSLGEAAGLTVEGKPLDAKEIIVEGIAGIGGAPVSIAAKAPGLLKNTEYIINGSKVNYNLAKEIVDGADATALAGMKIQVKNDGEFKDYAQAKQQDEVLKSQIDTRITDTQDRTDVFELEKELKQFQNKDTETAKIRAKEIKQEIADISAKYKRVGRRTAGSKALETQKLDIQDKVAQRVKEQLLDPKNKIGKTVAFAETAAEQIGLQEPTIASNTQQFLAALKNDNVNLDESSLSKVQAGLVGGAAFNGKIYINKEVAAKTGQINVGAHEVLHPIINARIQSQPEFVEQFKQTLTKNQLNAMEDLLTRRQYTGEQRAREYFTVFSDGIKNKDIKLNDSILQKIGNVILNILRPLGYTNASFKDAKGVFNFMREYNRSIEKGKLTKGALEAIGDTADLGGGALQLSTADQSFVQELGTNQNKQQWNTRGSQEAIEKMYTAGTFEKLIGSKITSQMRQLPDFNQEDFIMDTIGELIPHIRNFNPEVNDNLSGWINSQLQNKVNSVLKKGQVTQEQFTTDISEVAERTEFANSEIEDMSEIIAAENERLESLINPLDILPNKLKTEYIDAVKEALKDVDLNTLTFKNLNDLAPEVTGKFFSVPVIKVQQATKNLNQKEIPGVQEILRDNAKVLLALLPDGSVKEAASEKLINTGTLVPRKLLEAFYTKQERSTKGAGLFPFELNKNITVQDFYKAFGIKPDGGITAGLGGQTPQAQSMLAMIRLTGKLMTNTTVRSLIELQNDKAGVVNLNIGAGTSDLQLSQIGYETYQESLDNVAKKARDQLKMSHNLTDEQITEIINVRVLLADKAASNQTFPIDVVEKYISMQQKFREFIPASLYDIGIQLGLNGYSGNHYRVNTYGVTFKPEHLKNIVDEDGNPLDNTSERVKILKESLEAGARNAAYQTKENPNNYSDETKKELDKFNSLVKANGGSLKGLGFLLNSSNLSTIKDNLIGNKIQEVLEQTSTKDLNNLRKTLFNLLKYLETDFVKTAKEGRDKVDAIIFAKQLAGANSQILDGEKSFATMEGGAVYENTPKSGWRHEHMDASVNVATKGFSNVVSGKYSPVESRSMMISVAAAKAMDKSEEKGGAGKTGTYKEKFKWLRQNDTDAIGFIINGKFTPRDANLDLSIAFVDKIEANKAAYKKIKKEDRFDMLETVTRQMFPESANQPRGSYESLTPEQRLEVFNRMQESGMIAPGIQFSLAEDLAEKISNKSEIDATAEISEKKARLLGKNKGKWKFFIPPSADDFAGLMYYMIGKGKQGNADLAWFKKNLFDPFGKGINDFTTYRQFTMGQFRKMKKLLRGKNVKLKATNSTGFTNEVAVRVYIWATNGHEIPGLSEAEVKEMVNIVSNDSSLRNFASQIINLTSFAETPAPEKSWDGGTLTTDILDYLNTSSREKFLEEYLSNSEEIFGKIGQTGELEGETANRLRAAFGDNYIEALSDVLYRMKTGRRRISGSNKLTNQFINWINDSVGAIMFFNTRSALLQQLSFVNFINFSDNNPLAASAAFINQPQFWSDYVSLFNSDFLKERRSGLKTDVNADEIAKAAEEGKNPIRAVIASLLKKGFLPTQIADSHAIALGGASFYRNRLNRYIKEGMSKEDAAKQAFVDFQETAEETQQSSRPDRISLQQASGLGRLVLAFANTPMQYARLTKKAALDLINRRGDWKTNLSKLMYYGAVQNIVFSSLQTALFALAFDEEEEDEKTRSRYFRIANGTADGLLRGLGFGGAAVAAGKNMVLEGIRQSKLARPNYEEVAYEALKLSPPISSKIDKLASAGRMFTYRNTREKMKTAGFTLDNPIFESAGKIISATTNLPADRVIRKLDNLSTPVRQDVETWQAVSLALGYSKWDVGLIESKAKKPESSTKGLKKVKRKKIKRKKLKRKKLN